MSLYCWRREVWLFLLAFIGGMMIMGVKDGMGQYILGGCQTTEREYGLPVLCDTLAAAAVSELMAPGMGSKVGEACRKIGVEIPMFVQIGAVDSLRDETWRAISQQITARLAASNVHLAERTLLRRTTGPCFPRHHIDFQACGDSSSVRCFLADLTEVPWEGFELTPNRRERTLFVTAGTSLQLMETTVDLR